MTEKEFLFSLRVAENALNLAKTQGAKFSKERTILPRLRVSAPIESRENAFSVETYTGDRFHLSEAEEIIRRCELVDKLYQLLTTSLANSPNISISKLLDMIEGKE